MKDILQRLVQFHTVASDPQAMHEAFDYIADFVIKRGMHVERFDVAGAESLVATVVPGRKTPKVLLAAHLDVVPAPDELFEVREENGRLYGRGTMDMKFAIAAYLQLIDDLQDRLEDYDIGLMITSDEEIGGPGVESLIKEGYVPEVCILPDGGDNWQIQLHSKGFWYLRVSSHGKPAHGSRPWLGENAIYPLMDGLHAIRALFPQNEQETATVNIGSISGGKVINQVADYAEALVDVRFNHLEERDRLYDQVKAVCKKHNLTMDIVVEGDPTEFSLDDPYIGPFARAITEVTGITVKGSRTMGSNDARFFGAVGVPCVSLYPTGADHHGPEEWLAEQSLYDFKEVLGRYLDAVAMTATPQTKSSADIKKKLTKTA